MLIVFRACSSDLSPYSTDALNLQTLEKAYVFPYAITALAPTSTKFGITTKDLIGPLIHCCLEFCG